MSATVWKPQPKEQMPFDTRLTKTDWKLYESLWKKLRKENRSVFSADDLRTVITQLEEEDPEHHKIFPHPEKQIGMTLYKWKHHKLTEHYSFTHSKVESNHHRRIELFRPHGLKDTWEQTRTPPETETKNLLTEPNK